MSDSVTAADAQDAKLRSDIDRSLRHPVMFFFTSGALWLFITVLLGFLASYKTHSPEAFGDAGWLSTGRLNLAHQNALLYGWAFQAGFGAILWLMARLSRRECSAPIIILIAGHIWNFALSLGLLIILGGGGTGVTWLAFPPFLWPVFFVSYLLIVAWSVVQFQTRQKGPVFISQWYLLVAVLSFPWLYLTANIFVFVGDGHPLMKAAISEWYRGSLLLLFFAPIAIAIAYYITPKVTGRAIYSYPLAKFGFWSLVVIGPWSGFQKLTGAPIPNWLPYIGGAATILFLIPALAVAVNILKTIVDSDRKIVRYSPSLRFTMGGIVAMLVMGVSGVVLNAPALLTVTQFSIAGYGYDVLALYGFFSMCVFGLIYFVVPRVTQREWLSKRFIRSHFYLSVYGIIAIVLCSIFGGVMQGIAQGNYNVPWSDAADRSLGYNVGSTIAWAFILFANMIFLLHLILMWARLGRRSSHPTLLDGGHHADSAHGPEGSLEDLETAKA